MKKVILLGALGVFALASCKKDYTCSCTFSNSGSLKLEYKDVKKKTAEDSCDAAETTYKQGDASANCTLN